MHLKKHLTKNIFIVTFLLLAGVWLCLVPKHSFAAANPSQGEAPEMSWDDLVPLDWDPSEEFLDFVDEGAMSWDDNDPRAIELYERMRKVWDSAPTVPEVAGKKIKIPGYVVALETTKQGLAELLLVPNFGACIHVPPPPANQIIHIKLAKPVKKIESLDAIWATGILAVERNNSEMGISGYRLDNATIKPY